MLWRANLRSSCLRPTCSNSTVAFSLSPVPSMLMTLPRPKREWEMMVPMERLPRDDVDFDVDTDADIDCGSEILALLGCEDVDDTRRKFEGGGVGVIRQL